jgi:tetratricopeptide (TPR) repeat protein
MLHNQGKPPGEIQTCASKALTLSEKTTERERYFIQGSYYSLLGQREKAVAACEALLALYPDDYWAANLLAHIYDFEHDPGERQKALEVDTRLADTRPKDFFWNWGAVFDRVGMTSDPKGAALYLQRASALVTPEVAERFPVPVSYLKYVPFIHYWLDGDLWAAAVETDRIAEHVDSLGGRARDCMAVHAAFGYLTLGQIEGAEKISGKILDPVVRNDMLAQVAFLKGDTVAFRRYLDSSRNQESRKASEGFLDTIQVLQARAGIGSVPDSRLQFPYPSSDDTLHIARGEMALAHGRIDEAIRELEEGLKTPVSTGYIESDYLGRESLATAFLEKADIPRAIEVLERRADRRDAVVSGSTGAYWLRNRLQLAKLYRRAGRSKDAQAVEAELSRLLMLADTDHPILLELQRLEKS